MAKGRGCGKKKASKIMSIISKSNHKGGGAIGCLAVFLFPLVVVSVGLFAGWQYF